MKTKSDFKLRQQALASIPPEDRLLAEIFGTLEEEIQKRIAEIQSAKS